MRSSTSASDGGHRIGLRRAAWTLVGGCVTVALAAEGVARIALDRVSRVQRRVAREYQLAQRIGCDRAGSQLHVLVVGNSLLDEGVQFDRVCSQLGDGWDARRLVVEQTCYFDWYYGLKRLFREGARPDFVVVVLSPSQWVRPDSRGDFTAQYLLNMSDVSGAARDLGLNATQTTNLFMARVSKFWGTRTEIRNFVLGHLMPDFGRLTDFSMTIDSTPIVDAEVEMLARARIERLSALVRANGARLFVLVPPVLDANDGAAGLTRAARAFGVPVMRPVASGAFGKHLYRDTGFHLNAAGAGMFTDHFVRALRTELLATRGAPGAIATTGPSSP